LVGGHVHSDWRITPVLLMWWSNINCSDLKQRCSNSPFYRYYIIMLSTMGKGDLICRLVIGPLITVWKLDVPKLYAISQIACAITIASFPTVVNGVQMIIQGFLFSVTFGCQCLFLGNLLRWSNESAFDFVPLNLMVLFFSSRSACAFRKWKFESNLRRLYVFRRDWHSYWSTDRKYLFILLFEIIVSFFFVIIRQDLLWISRQVALIGWPLSSLLSWNFYRRSPQ
jgi:hypothetical protein